MPSPIESISYSGAFAVVPSDATVVRFNAIYVGTSGNLTVRTSLRETVLFSNVPAGTILPIVGDMIMATGTTATNIVGMYYQ